MESQLIYLIKHCSHIYDPKDKHHRDSGKVENSWMFIAQSLNVTVEQAKKTWRNLRDNFTRERRKCLSVSGSLGTAKSKWPYMEAMSFFNDFIAVRRSSSTNMIGLLNDETEDSTSSCSLQHETLPEAEVEAAEMVETVLEEQVAGSSSSSSDSGIPRKARKKDGQVSALEMYILKEMQKTSETDAYEHYGLSVASHLRKLPELYAMKAKLEIMGVLVKYREMVENNSE